MTTPTTAILMVHGRTADNVQHKRTKTCSACKTSSEEYADHVDANGDGKCDDCGATVSLTVTWDAGSNGGIIDGKASFSETVKPNSKPTIPASLPVKKGHSFKGWYTAKTGGKPLQYRYFDHGQHNVLRAV